MRNKIIAALLAFFAGAFGVHRFYLGQIGKGFLYLLFSWTLIPSIIAIIDCISFLLMDDERFDRLYNKELYYEEYGGDNLLDSTPRYVKRRSERNDGRIKINSQADEIEKLHDLMIRGIISEREFEERKNMI